MSERMTMTLSSRPKQALWGLCTRHCCTFSCPHVTVSCQQQGSAWVTGQGAPEKEHFWAWGAYTSRLAFVKLHVACCEVRVEHQQVGALCIHWGHLNSRVHILLSLCGCTEQAHSLLLPKRQGQYLVGNAIEGCPAAGPTPPLHIKPCVDKLQSRVCSPVPGSSLQQYPGNLPHLHNHWDRPLALG